MCDDDVCVCVCVCSESRVAEPSGVVEGLIGPN